ncbi:MAG: hypothetical protein A3H28_01485 [Acidobacteria bacterium RIFCSPLOWO2_02_FULL_61_28]|nr:MAG: hypothetical protein A3H28_01485 [Acidobacteria bacterium RIFCSPLOWO2_02_FULL_61_28]
MPLFVAMWLAVLVGLAGLPTPSRAQGIEWIRQFGTSTEDQAAGVARDSTAVYVSGFTWGVFPGQTNAGLQDAYVRKYDANGTEQWTRQFGSTGGDRAFAVAADSTGVYVVGWTSGALPGQTYLGGVSDVFVRKYDANGNVLWTRQFGTAARDGANGVAVDGSGSVYVGGYTTGTLPGQLTNAGLYDSFVRKYDTNGTEQWTRQFGQLPTGDDAVHGVAADSTGVYVGGRLLGTLPGQTAAGGYDAFVRKYNGGGTEQWTRQFGTTGNDAVNGLAADSTGVYVTGGTEGALPGQTSAGLGVRDAFVRKYDANGTEQWTRQFGTRAQDEAFGVAADASGVHVVGTAGFALPGLPSSTVGQVFARKYDANGAERATQQFGAGGSEAGTGVAADATGIYVSGHTNGRIPGQTFLGSSDAFAVKLGIPAELIVRPEGLKFSGLVGGSADHQALQIGASGGAIAWSATATLLNGTGWLTVSPPSGTATASTPSKVGVEVNFGAFAEAGLYQAVIVIRDTTRGAAVRVPVAVAVSPARSRLLLSQSSFVFRMREGGAAPPQTLRIFNGGLGDLNWTIPANLTAPQNWLRFSALSGTSSAGRLGASSTILSISGTGLGAGVYQALVPVSAPGATNDPQLASVTLHVVPAPTAASAEMSPNGMVFVAGQGGAAPAAQTLTVSNNGGGSLSFQLQATTVSGGNWLTAAPATGSAAAGPATVQVSANHAGLTGGIYRGRITATYSSGGTEDTEVVLAVSTDPVAPQRELPTAAVCAPQEMELVITSIGNGSVLSVSFPRPLLATVVDSCGSAVSNATVVANVETRSITLRGVGNGLYSETWTPERESSSVAVSFTALHSTYSTVQRSVTVSTVAAAGQVSLPAMLPDGVVEGAGFTPQRPLAPGGIISIFGSRFAASDRFATRVPLERDLDGVSVRIGNENAPLYFAGPSQINAQMPLGVQAGGSVSVVVNVGGKLTAPQSYAIAPAQPGIFIAGSNGAILDGQSRLITAANPARIGDTLQIYTTGLGETDPPAKTGEAAPAFSRVLLPVTVTVGGIESPVVYQGLAPGFVGLYQVNVVLPSTVTPGDAVPVVVQQNGIVSNPDLPATIPVR